MYNLSGDSEQGFLDLIVEVKKSGDAGLFLLFGSLLRIPASLGCDVIHIHNCMKLGHVPTSADARLLGEVFATFRQFFLACRRQAASKLLQLAKIRLKIRALS